MQESLAPARTGHRAKRSEERRNTDHDRDQFIRVCLDFIEGGDGAELRFYRRTLDGFFSVAAFAVAENAEREGVLAFWTRVLDECGEAPSVFDPGRQTLRDDVAFALRAVEALQSARLSHASYSVRVPSCVVLAAGGTKNLRRMKKLWRFYAMFMSDGHLRAYDLPNFRHFVRCVFFILYVIYTQTSRDFGIYAKAVSAIGKSCAETLLSEKY